MEHLFTNPAAIETLQAQLRVLAAHSPHAELRAWVAGCGTGEDAYACAILLHEAAAQRAGATQVKVFATDSDTCKLAAARAGAYPEALIASLKPAQRRYFFAARETIHLNAAVREVIAFASHELLNDPPFSRLDLAICRELFTALDTAQRAHAIARFAFALRPGGLLLLGDELRIEDERFQDVDSSLHLYTRGASAPRQHQGRAAAMAAAAPRPATRDTSTPAMLARLPALIIDASWQILHLGAGVEHFLQVRSGALSYHLFDAIHPALREVVQATTTRAMVRNRAAESPLVEVMIGAAPERVTVIAQPPPSAHSGELMVLFESADAGEPGLSGGQALAEAYTDLQGRHRVAQAEHELAVEELHMANEELRVLNEELQVATQELEARREELQTLNEELRTINQEQALSLTRIDRLNADLQNLMASADIGTLFLDRELRVQRYTPQMQAMFHFFPADLGRPLAHFSHQLAYDELLDDARRLLAELRPIEREVAHQDGRWFLVRMRPYRGDQDRIGGVVLTFLDISERKQAELALRQAHAQLEQRVRERTAELEQTHAARRALLRELVQAQEQERLRIARDLHDQFGQQITAALLGLRAAQNAIEPEGPAVAQIESVRTIVQALGKEIRQVASDLRPTALDDVGLAEALQSYAEGWSGRTGIAVSFFETGLKDRALPSEIETTIYRVVLEALTNVVRHAEAAQVSLILERHQGMLIMMIEDDGKGFDIEATLQHMRRGGHMGLLGMQERVELIHGTLTIESAPGSGATVIARIPLHNSEGQNNDKTQNIVSR